MSSGYNKLKNAKQSIIFSGSTEGLQILKLNKEGTQFIER